MMYILSEEEMAAVNSDRANLKELLKILPSRKELQRVCTQAANEWPSFTGWNGKLEPQPWGCIITAEYEHYCDECPMQNICPHEDKQWSK